MVAYGLLGFTRQEDILDCEARVFLKRWSAYEWSRTMRHEADYTNRMLMATVASSFSKDSAKEKLIRQLSIINEDLERKKAEDEYNNLEVIGGGRSR